MVGGGEITQGISQRQPLLFCGEVGSPNRCMWHIWISSPVRGQRVEGQTAAYLLQSRHAVLDICYDTPDQKPVDKGKTGT